MSRKWETKSLEWIHQVREDLDREIQDRGLKVSQWIKSKKDAGLEALCKKLGLRNCTIRGTTTRTR